MAFEMNKPELVLPPKGERRYQDRHIVVGDGFVDVDGVSYGHQLSWAAGVHVVRWMPDRTPPGYIERFIGASEAFKDFTIMIPYVNIWAAKRAEAVKRQEEAEAAMALDKAERVAKHNAMQAEEDQYQADSAAYHTAMFYLTSTDHEILKMAERGTDYPTDKSIIAQRQDARAVVKAERARLQQKYPRRWGIAAVGEPAPDHGVIDPTATTDFTKT